jgi:hypothetical protein
MRAGVAYLLLALAALLLACGENNVAPITSPESLTPVATEAPTPRAPSPTPPASLAATSTVVVNLAPAEPGFIWHQISAIPEYGMPGYAVQAPIDWATPHLAGNPVSFTAPDSNEERIVQLTTRTTPYNLGWEHPILLDLPMSGTTCGEGKPTLLRSDEALLVSDTPPAEVITSDKYMWNVYYFLCGTRITAADALEGKESIPFDVRGAEAQAGDVVLSVMTYEPPGSGAGAAAFLRAIQSMTRQ